MPALSYFDYLYGATSELSMYLLHLPTRHSFCPFRVSVVFNVYSRLLGHVATHSRTASTLGNLDLLDSPEYDTHYKLASCASTGRLPPGGSHQIGFL
jgi:hypothetical protein